MVDDVTAVVITVKVAVKLPAATVTLDGMVADVLLLDSATEIPPAGAGALKVTVPVDELPPGTLAGLSDTEESVTPCAAVNDKVTVEFAAIDTLS